MRLQAYTYTYYAIVAIVVRFRAAPASVATDVRSEPPLATIHCPP